MRNDNDFVTGGILPAGYGHGGFIAGKHKSTDVPIPKGIGAQLDHLFFAYVPDVTKMHARRNVLPCIGHGVFGDLLNLLVLHVDFLRFAVWMYGFVLSAM